MERGCRSGPEEGSRTESLLPIHLHFLIDIPDEDGAAGGVQVGFDAVADVWK